jgi:hypothetical protein
MASAPADRILECLTDSKWLEPIFLKMDLGLLEFLSDALAELAVHGDEKWRASLPHIYATAYEKAINDPDRRKLLFGLTVVACMHTDTSSAIDRLVQGQYRNETKESVEYWRGALENMRLASPEWVSARIRAIMASLHVV